MKTSYPLHKSKHWLFDDHYSWHVLESLSKARFFIWIEGWVYSLPDSQFKDSKYRFLFIGDNNYPIRIY